MNRFKKSIVTGAVAWALLGLGPAIGRAEEQPAPAGEQPESAVPAAVSMMGMAAGSLTANPKPISFEAGPLGPVLVSGVVSGLGLWQNNKFPDQQHSQASLSNGQVFFQKNEGLFQYFVQVGAYTLPSLGTPYFSTATTTGDFFGPVPVAFAKIAPTDNFYVQGGKMAGLVGVEAPFTFQNMNIERGLLWAQEPLITRGAQLGYTQGPLALALQWTDGFYSNRYTWLTGSATYTLDPATGRLYVPVGNSAPNFLPHLRARFSVPFVGTVPAIKPACASSRSKRVSVLGTQATVAREYTQNLIRDFGASIVQGSIKPLASDSAKSGGQNAASTN